MVFVLVLLAACPSPEAAPLGPPDPDVMVAPAMPAEPAMSTDPETPPAEPVAAPVIAPAPVPSAG